MVRSLSAIKQMTHLSLFASSSTVSLRTGISTGSSGCFFASSSQSIFLRVAVRRSDWDCSWGKGGQVRGRGMSACSRRNPSASSTKAGQRSAIQNKLHTVDGFIHRCLARHLGGLTSCSAKSFGNKRLTRIQERRSLVGSKSSTPNWLVQNSV